MNQHENPEDTEIYSYKRFDSKKSLMIVSNFTDQTLERSFEEKVVGIVISNYQDSPLDLSSLRLRPYESVVYEILV